MSFDPVDRHAVILATAAEQLNKIKVGIRLGEEFRKLLDLIKELEAAGLSDQAEQLKQSLSAVRVNLPAPPRPRGRPRKQENTTPLILEAHSREGQK